MRSKFTMVLAAAGSALLLTACGGSGSDMTETPPAPPPPTTYTVVLPDGHGLSAGMTTLPYGDTEVGDTTISCPSMSGCDMTVSQNPVTGAWTATAIGGAVTVAYNPPPPPVIDPGPDPMQLAAAQDAARDAWRDARAELAGLAGKEGANPAAYQHAVDAVADAKAAYDAALAATTVAEAEMAQADAEDAKAIALAQVGMVVTSYEAPALEAAQAAAMAAADAAKAAYEAAMAALAAVEEIKDADMASYDMAMIRVAAAKAAYDAAMAASNAAAATSSVSEAQAQQATAEGAKADADAANSDASMYAGLVQTAEDDAVAVAAQAEADALMAAQTGAQTAYDKAKMAYDVAVARFDALGDKKADNIPDHTRASDALAQAKTAYDAAMAANAMAQAAGTSADAAMYQAAAEAAAADVDAEVADANRYVALVEASYMSAQAVRDRAAEAAEAAEVAAAAEAKALADAKTAAMTAATAARTAATTARTEATKVSEKLGSSSQSAIDADAAATAAEAAATAAETASGMAQAATTSADAIKYQKMAEGEESKADTQLASAAELARQAGVATAGLDQLRIELARDAAGEAKDAAADAATKARAAAVKARMAAADAADDAAMAKRARLDYTNAKMKADDAATAATAAEAAATDAEAASSMAEAEYMKAMAADVSVADARAARDEARSQRDTATTSNTEAGAQYTVAMTAAGEASESAMTHVLSLLAAANDQSQTDMMKRDATIMAVAAVIGSAAGTIPATDRDNDSQSADGSGTSGATASWLGMALDDVDTANIDESKTVVPLSITVNTATGDENSLAFRTKAAEDDTATTDVDESVTMPKTATKIAGLTGFTHGYSITDDGTHAIVFTDKMQGADEVEAVTAVTARSVVGEDVDTADELKLGADKTGPTYAGVTWTPSGQEPLTGTLSCSTDGCDIAVSADGTVASIEGYEFTGSRDAVEGVEAADAMENEDYLVFGVWLREAVTDGDDAVALAFAAFAGGGQPVAATTYSATLTGTAKYTGKATGVYTAGESVDYFQGNAELTANFGEKPETGEDTVNGTIKGMIDNIVAGGESMSDEIRLSGTNINEEGAFSGNARMGSGEIQDDDTVKYPYNGSWSGNFYGPANDDDATEDVTEGPANTAPAAAAGTFGVTGTMGEGDDAVTRSYVGAFGARR